MKKLLNKWRAYIRENENDVLTEQKEQVLRRGMRDKDPNGPIRKLQNMLKNLKPPLYAEQPDGIYGGKTQEAVKDFQRTQVKAKKMPPRNERGRSNINGIAGPMTMALLQQASGSSKSAPKAKEPQNRKVALTNGIAARLKSDLSGFVDEGEMDNVVTLLKFADKNGILAAVSQKYMSMTGDGLQATIRGVMGVHELKNQALKILGGKAAKKDITTQLGDATPQTGTIDAILQFFQGDPIRDKKALEAKNLLLVFNGEHLKAVADGQVVRRWTATTGKLDLIDHFSPFNTPNFMRKALQGVKDFGGIPEGMYRVGDLQTAEKYVKPGMLDKLKYIGHEIEGVFGGKKQHHEFRAKTIGSKIAWGEHRIRIYGRGLPKVYPEAARQRGGFFIHGGELEGSSGCLDLGEDMPDFAKWWTMNTIGRRKKLFLKVQYPFLFDADY